MAFAQRVLHLVLLALVGALLALPVCAQYIHRGWQPGLPSRLDGEPVIGAHYRKDAGWSPQGTGRSSVYGDTRAGGTPVPPPPSPSEPRPPRGPRNETVTERLMRLGLTKVLRWSDERVDETQDQMRAKTNPTFHPRIHNLSGCNQSYVGFLELLGFSGSGTGALGEDARLASMASSVTGRSPKEPWAILFSAPAGDKESQKFDAVFNRTIHSLWPDPSTGYVPLIKGAEKSDVDATKAAEESKASAAATPSLPEGYEVVGGFTVRVAEPTAALGPIPKRQGFLGQVLPAVGSLLTGSGAGAPTEPEDDMNARAETELTGKEVLTPAQWGTREALVEKYRPVIERDGLRFAYVDYTRHPVVEWNWGIWKVPLIVFVAPSPPGSERPFDLRYWKVSQRLPSVNEIISFWGTGAWKALPVWDSAWAPGGEKFPRMLTASALLGNYYYPVLERVPSWVLMLISTAIAGFLPQLMHRGDSRKLKEADEIRKRRKAVEEAVKQSMAAEAKEQEEKEAEAALLAARDSSAAPPQPPSPAVSASKPRAQVRKRTGRR